MDIISLSSTSKQRLVSRVSSVCSLFLRFECRYVDLELSVNCGVDVGPGPRLHLYTQHIDLHIYIYSL